MWRLQVGEFWHELEAATNERQRKMFRQVNRHLEALSRAIESAVADQLDVRLEAVDIRLTPPTADAFHASLQELFNDGGVFTLPPCYTITCLGQCILFSACCRRTTVLTAD